MIGEWLNEVWDTYNLKKLYNLKNVLSVMMEGNPHSMKMA